MLIFCAMISRTRRDFELCAKSCSLRYRRSASSALPLQLHILGLECCLGKYHKIRDAIVRICDLLLKHFFPVQSDFDPSGEEVTVRYSFQVGLT